ncbi:hypothetical protein, partial [Streptomyces sp. AB3(2024)]|uniref:hypothetical protein n=1 Tax=Streptomyces sp. AB3(2024) TaxID=3317321 RepID=UPI0035A3B88E
PTLRIVALVATGTRGLIGATVGSAEDGDEVTFARGLLPHPSTSNPLDNPQHRLTTRHCFAMAFGHP